jgi:hypothetical protein
MQQNNAPPEFNGWQALFFTVQYLSIHVWIMLGTAAVFWLALLCTHRRSEWPTGRYAKARFAFLDFSYILAFALFGVSTAFFLSLGIKRAPTGESTNGLVELFAAPFISLLTAGAVFITSRGAVPGEKPPRVAVCVACFLCATIVSYRTFFYQILTNF